ncbi:methylmalonyl-CoA mutase, partial [bacterium]|nr:methylmalonyl-CoA mutase [bacterium]
VMTAGSSLTAQQPMNNIVRVAIESLAAVLGGCQVLSPCSMDEAYCTPTEPAVKLALRTQQIIANETGVARTVDPLAGSYFIESLTDRVEDAAVRVLREVDAAGGAVAALEAGVVQRMIEDAAYRTARSQDAGDLIVVGVNRFTDDAEANVPVTSIDPELERAQTARVQGVRERRDAGFVHGALADVERVARDGGNLLYPMKAALGGGATLGEVSATLAGVFGRYRPAS